MRPKTFRVFDVAADDDDTMCKLSGTGVGFAASHNNRSAICVSARSVYKVVRTLLFMHTFQWAPNKSLNEIYKCGQLEYTTELVPRNFTLNEACAMWDTVLGKGFSVVANQAAMKCYREYADNWLTFPFNRSPVYMPSIDDYATLFEFANIVGSRTEIDQFVKVRYKNEQTSRM